MPTLEDIQADVDAAEAAESSAAIAAEPKAADEPASKATETPKEPEAAAPAAKRTIKVKGGDGTDVELDPDDPKDQERIKREYGNGRRVSELTKENAAIKAELERLKANAAPKDESLFGDDPVAKKVREMEERLAAITPDIEKVRAEREAAERDAEAKAVFDALDKVVANDKFKSLDNEEDKAAILERAWAMKQEDIGDGVEVRSAEEYLAAAAEREAARLSAHAERAKASVKPAPKPAAPVGGASKSTGGRVPTQITYKSKAERDADILADIEATLRVAH